MWGQVDMGMEGGFLNTNNNNFLSGQKGNDMSPNVSSKRFERAQNIVPISASDVVRFMSDSGETTLKVSGEEVNLCFVCGRLDAIERSSMKVVYTLSDWSGASIQAVRWMEGEAGVSSIACDDDGGLCEGVYCRVVSSIRPDRASHPSGSSTPTVRCFDIRQIGADEYDVHRLETQHARLKLKALAESNGDRSIRSSTQQPPGSLGQTPALQGADVIGLTGNQKLVYTLIQQNLSQEGVDRQTIVTSLRSRVSRQEIDQILEYLSNEGHLYNTIDDDHFKATDC